MSKFIQIIEFTSSRRDELEQLAETFREARTAEGTGGRPARGTITADRDRPGHFLNIIEFDSYEEAMENSNRPETTEFAARMAELCDAPPRFYNLDVMDVWESGGAR